MIEKILSVIIVVLVIACTLLVLTRITINEINFDGGIHTSEGLHFDEITGENLQAAIDSLVVLDGYYDYWFGGGTVWVGGNIDIYEPIIQKSYVTVDFLGHDAVMKDNVDFVYLTDGIFHSTIKNVFINLSSDPVYDATVIHIYLPPESVWGDHIRYNAFENIEIRNKSPWKTGEGYSEHNYTGIWIENRGETNTFWNIFRDISMRACGSGIKLTQTTEVEAPALGVGWNNGNLFEHIFINQCRIAIEFETDDNLRNGFNRNLFLDVKSQSSQYCPPTEYGVKDIQGNGNAFVDMLIWDWHVCVNGPPNYGESGIYVYWVGDDAYDTRLDINGRGVETIPEYYLDEGTRTTLQEGRYDYILPAPEDYSKIFGLSLLEIILIIILIILLIIIVIKKVIL